MDSLSSSRVAVRWLSAGVFEAPPAMVATIGEWVQAVVAANAIQAKNQSIEEYQGFRKSKEPRFRAVRQSAQKLLSLVPTGTSKVLWEAAKSMVEEAVTVEALPRGFKLDLKDFQGLTPEKRATLTKMVESRIANMEVRVESYLSQGERQIQDLKRQQDKLKPWANPNVPAMTGKEIRKEFPVDLRGWRYGDAELQKKILETLGSNQRDIIKTIEESANASGALQDVVQRFKQDLEGMIKGDRHFWSHIQVVLSYDLNVQNARAYWQEMPRELAIKIPTDAWPSHLEDTLLNTLRHELQHFGQSFMSAALGQALTDYNKLRRLPGPGMPSRHIMTPQRMQQNRSQGEAGNHQPIRRDQEDHALDDIEFFTRLADMLRDAKRLLKERNNQWLQYYQKDLTPEQEHAVLSRFMGLPIKDPKMRENFRTIPMNDFLGILQRAAPKKYQRAVRELVKQLW